MAQRARKRKRADPLPADRRRSAIVEATRALLVEHGEMVTTRQIARAAGVAEGTIFGVFADRDAVIAAVVDAACDWAPTEDALRALDPGDRLEALLTDVIELLQRRTIEGWRLLSSVGPRSRTLPGAPWVAPPSPDC